MSGIFIGLPDLSVVVTALCSVAIVFLLQRNAANAGRPEPENVTVRS